MRVQVQLRGPSSAAPEGVPQSEQPQVRSLAGPNDTGIADTDTVTGTGVTGITGKLGVGAMYRTLRESID